MASGVCKSGVGEVAGVDAPAGEHGHLGREGHRLMPQQQIGLGTATSFVECPPRVERSRHAVAQQHHRRRVARLGGRLDTRLEGPCLIDQSLGQRDPGEAGHGSADLDDQLDLDRHVEGQDRYTDR